MTRARAERELKSAAKFSFLKKKVAVSETPGELRNVSRRMDIYISIISKLSLLEELVSEVNWKKK